MDPEDIEALEILEGVESAMDTEAELDLLPEQERFPVADEEYGHGGVDEIADVEGFPQPRSEWISEPFDLE